VQIIELKRFGGAPHHTGYPLSSRLNPLRPLRATPTRPRRPPPPPSASDAERLSRLSSSSVASFASSSSSRGGGSRRWGGFPKDLLHRSNRARRGGRHSAWRRSPTLGEWNRSPKDLHLRWRGEQTREHGEPLHAPNRAAGEGRGGRGAPCWWKSGPKGGRRHNSPLSSFPPFDLFP
jgi:hypothetical protein